MNKKNCSRLIEGVLDVKKFRVPNGSIVKQHQAMTVLEPLMLLVLVWVVMLPKSELTVMNQGSPLLVEYHGGVV